MAERLQRLALAGCDVDKAEVALLDTFVGHDRDPLDPFFEGHFDLCGCAQPRCPKVGWCRSWAYTRPLFSSTYQPLFGTSLADWRHPTESV